VGGDSSFNLFWRSARLGDRYAELVLLGDQGRRVLSRHRPVHCRAEVEDVCLWCHGFSFDLLGCDVVGCALYSAFDGSYFAALPEVYYLDRARFVHEDVVGLDVAVDIAVLMHGVQGRCYQPEDKQNVAEAERGAVFEVFAVEILHREEYLLDLEHAANLFELVAFADVGVVNSPAVLVLSIHLLEDSVVFGALKNDPF